MSIVAIVLQVLLALAFLLTAVRKLAGTKASVQMRDLLHVAPWFWMVTGVIELVAAVGLVVGIWIAPLAVLGALLLVATMAGAVFTQLVNRQPFQRALPAVVLLALGLVVVLAHWSDATRLLG
ncbi:MAG TPA: DoxX family protein [Ktedonobacterales bacterium]|nr:DoxX family protein [Ktedonobacterales bacterium]